MRGEHLEQALCNDVWKRSPEGQVERAMGIEPTALAWEARVLPLYDARAVPHFTRGLWILAIWVFRRCVRFWGESLGIDSHRRRFLRFPLVRFHAVFGLS